MDRRRRRVATVALFVACVTQAQTQTSLWPPVLLPAPVDPAAPAASVALLPGKSMIVNAVAVDAQENVYLAGSGTAPDVPGLERGLKSKPDGVDAFVAKLDRSGNPVWATYIGGTDRRVPAGRVVVTLSDAANAIAVDAAGDVYIAGRTGTDNFPVVNALQPARLGSDADAFLVKISADGRRLIYSTYIGARDVGSSGNGIAVGPAGEVWLGVHSTAERWSVDHDLSSPGRTSGEITLKLNPAARLVWSTRLPFSTAGGFAVDGSGRTYVAGANCDVAGTCNQGILRLSASGSQLDFITTFLNARYGSSFPSRLALLPGSRAVFTGVQYEHPLPVENAWRGPRVCPFGCGDAFVGVVGSTGAIETMSYLGLGEQAPVVTADALGRITIAASSGGSDLPLVRPLLDYHVEGPVYRSQDRATTWAVASRNSPPSWGVADLVFDRGHNSLRLVARNMYESRDDGVTWRLESEAVFESWYRVAVDPRQPSIRYAIFGDHVYRNDEGESTWRIVARSGGGTYRRTVVVSPHDSSVWIAGNAGVAMSADGGQTWSNRSNGLPSIPFSSSSTVVDLHFDPLRRGVVYASTQRGLYATTDGGFSWQHLTAGFTPAPNVVSVAFDPVRSDRLYVATLNYGLLLTPDAGRTWTRKLENHRITVVATDHLKRHIAYAGGSDAESRTAFYRSIDYGETWHVASTGLYMRSEPSRLLVDPRDSARLYLASSSGAGSPYVMRLRSTAANPRMYAAEFGSYLATGTIRALAPTVGGGLVAALTHTWPALNPDQQQIVTVRIGP